MSTATLIKLPSRIARTAYSRRPLPWLGSAIALIAVVVLWPVVVLVHEVALKAREAAQLWTESYPAMELRHGPISVLDSASAVWILGPPPAGLIDDVTATGALVTSSGSDPTVELIRAQRAAVTIARRRGLDPDQPRNLNRAVLLADTP